MDRAHFDYKLYAISESAKILKTAIDDGASIIQLRDKSGDLNSIKEKALEVKSFKQNGDFLFILNDYPELAKEVGTDGVHIGQDSSILEVRKLVGDNFIIGKTTHSLEQGLLAEQEGADYISVGPIFETPTKPGRKAVGLEYIRLATKHIELPFVAIGGIDLTNIEDILNSGAKTVGIVRAVKDVKELYENHIKRRNF